MLELNQAVDRMVLATQNPGSGHALALVGVSGIGGSGKGFIAEKLRGALVSRGIRVALCHADDWLSLPELKYRTKNAARHYYQHALRTSEMLMTLIHPLLTTGQASFEFEAYIERTQTYAKQQRQINDVELVILEGILLFRPPLSEYFDLKIWVDCPFDVALSRALSRNQEALSNDELKRKYETIYHPAQQIHLEEDQAIALADVVIENGAVQAVR